MVLNKLKWPGAHEDDRVSKAGIRDPAKIKSDQVGPEPDPLWEDEELLENPAEEEEEEEEEQPDEQGQNIYETDLFDEPEPEED